ncbi:hypothetical protein [Streptomyces sp. NPDC088674]|uniref:hypothetical protein n=1 Tax=Streptomyces sp. NPDC088674 TaxID=3365869 RepID=UPI0037FA2979
MHGRHGGDRLLGPGGRRRPARAASRPVPPSRSAARRARAGELPAGPDTPALAAYVATVLQGLSPQARDGATAVEPDAVAALALAVRPGA